MPDDFLHKLTYKLIISILRWPQSTITITKKKTVTITEKKTVILFHFQMAAEYLQVKTEMAELRNYKVTRFIFHHNSYQVMCSTYFPS